MPRPVRPAGSTAARALRPAAGPWLRSADQGLRALGLCALGLFLPFGTLPLLLGVAPQHPAPISALLVLVLAQSLTVVKLLAGPTGSQALAWPLLALLVAGSAALAPWLDPRSAPATSFGYWAAGTVALGLRTGGRTSHARLVLFAALGLCLAQFQLPPAPTWLRLANLAWTVVPLALAVLFAQVLSLVGKARAQATEQALQADWERKQLELATQARRESARLLHDHVLHALLAICRAGERMPVAQVREACREAGDALRHDDVSTDTILLEDLLADDPLVHELGAVLTGDATPVPTGVARTLASAIHEALRNVQRHARASQCRVEVSQLPLGLRVRVVDDGRGFDADAHHADRLGVGGSIKQRVTDVGGSTDIRSRPGYGTVVDICWPAVDVADQHEWRAAPTPLVRRRLVRTVLPHLLGALVVTLLVFRHVDHPLLALVAGLGGAALAGVVALVLRHRPLAPLGDVAVVVVAGLLWAVNLWLVPGGATSPHQLWLAWSAAALVDLVVQSTRFGVSRAIAWSWAVVQAAGMVVVLGPEALWTQPFVLFTGAAQALATVLVLRVSRLASQEESRAAHAAAQARAATARLELGHQLDRFWSRRVGQEALPLVRGVARGTIDPTDPRVQARAAAVEASLRDELRLGPGREQLVGALATARAEGWRVTNTLDQSTASGEVAGAHHLLGLLGSTAQPGQVVTLSSCGGQVTALVLEPSGHQVDGWRTRAAGGPATVLLDEDFARLSVPA